jgi:hypothetical protein
MAKRKKTREQKILAEIRRHQQVLLNANNRYSVVDNIGKTENPIKSKESQIINSAQPIAIANHYQYLTRDFKKTALVTTGIIILQVILHFIIK